MHLQKNILDTTSCCPPFMDYTSNIEFITENKKRDRIKNFGYLLLEITLKTELNLLNIEKSLIYI